MISSSSIVLFSSLAGASGGSTLSEYKSHSLKSAESPTPKSRVVDKELSRTSSGGSKAVDHLYRLGEGGFQMGSKSVTPFRSLRLEGNRHRKEGKQPVQAMSAISGSKSAAPSRFKNHVDSLILQSRRVVRALDAEDKSCEIIFENHGVGGKRDPILLEAVEKGASRGKGKAKVVAIETDAEDDDGQDNRHDCIFCVGMPDIYEKKEARKGEGVGDSPALLAAKAKVANGLLAEVGSGPFIPGVGYAKVGAIELVGPVNDIGQSEDERLGSHAYGDGWRRYSGTVKGSRGRIGGVCC
ncbi:DNA (cytosine-5)-methyltransferase 1 [Corchorus olitorius]|uniref:DNA (Cytosine-5)-methyltransferase 1 n=1 Tax=Corchorus olitorius TaxID=93759 RepID=A0A1R3IKD2_9ROSI|nr:DNA (cytosine-5)-methyltransferase 1 [Corchorus olitorius]